MNKIELEKCKYAVNLQSRINDEKSNIQILKDFLKRAESDRDLSQNIETPRTRQMRSYVVQYLPIELFKELIVKALSLREDNLKSLEEEFYKL